jgi:Family of unknown function (DUF6703)
MPRPDDARQPNITAFERWSTPYLLRLHSMPRWSLTAILVIVLVLGLFIHGPVGATLLLGLAAFSGWLAAVGWRLLTPATKFLRVLVVALLVVAGLGQLR